MWKTTILTRRFVFANTKYTHSVCLLHSQSLTLPSVHSNCEVWNLLTLNSFKVCETVILPKYSSQEDLFVHCMKNINIHNIIFQLYYLKNIIVTFLQWSTFQEKSCGPSSGVGNNLELLSTYCKYTPAMHLVLLSW